MDGRNIKTGIATGRWYGYKPVHGKELQFAEAAQNLYQVIHSTHGDAFRYDDDEYQRRRQSALEELDKAIKAIEEVSAMTPKSKPTLA